MQYLAIALVWLSFAAFVLAAKMRRKAFTIAFLIAALLAALALSAWGVFRNF